VTGYLHRRAVEHEALTLESRMDCERHRAVSLRGTIERDGEPLPFTDGDHRSLRVMEAAKRRWRVLST
jgi:hypothetical protein